MSIASYAQPGLFQSFNPSTQQPGTSLSGEQTKSWLNLLPDSYRDILEKVEPTPEDNGLFAKVKKCIKWAVLAFVGYKVVQHLWNKAKDWFYPS